jgi:glycosyltransferase involved in cell wall biosynthesis
MTLSSKQFSFSVVIPAYNEENGITAILNRVLAVKPSLTETGAHEMEVIIVDDGSRDGTAKVVEP